jgi:hypothetical protein
MAINSATYQGPSGAQTITLTITPQHPTDVAFVVTSFQDIAPTNNLVLNPITTVADAVDGNTVYSGTWLGGADNAYVNKVFVVTSLATQNIGTFICKASAAGTVTLNNPSGTAAIDQDGTATCGWISIGDSSNWIVMQQLNSMEPVVYETGLSSDYGYPWAALIATVPTLGAVGTVSFPQEGSAVWAFDTDTYTTEAFAVPPGAAIFGFMPLSNDESFAEPAGPATNISDTLGNVYQQVYAVNTSVSRVFANAWLIAAFNSSASETNQITATMANSVGQNGSIIVFSGLASVPPSCSVTGNFYDLTDSPIANGSYTVTLSEDAYLVSGGQISAGVVASGSLTSEGGLEGLALFSTDPSIMKSFSGNELFYAFTIKNALGITVWHSEFQLPPEPTFVYNMEDFTPPISYCYSDPGLMFLG